jgi:hypothetical protein
MTGNITEKQQIVRIAALLGELEALSRDATSVPPPLQTQARASIEKARSLLQKCEEVADRPTPEDEDDGDPQPDVDSDLLERMYRDLGAGRPPTKR